MIALEGSPSLNGYSAAATSHSVALPTGVTAGEFLGIVILSNESNRTPQATGYTFKSFSMSTDTSYIMGVLWKEAGASESTPITVDFAEGGSGAIVSTSFRLSGVDMTDPFNSNTGIKIEEATASASHTVAADSITVTSGAGILLVMGCEFNRSVTAADADLDVTIGNTASTLSIHVYMDTEVSGTGNPQYDFTTNDTRRMGFNLFELKPASSGTELTAPLLAAGTTLASPDLVQKVDVTTPDYGVTSIFYAYTGDTPASPDFFYIRESTFGNTTADGTGDLTQTTSAPVDFNYFDDSAGTWSGWVTFDVADLSVPTLSSGTVLYEMTVQGDEITLSPPLLDSSASLYASTVSATYGLEVPLLDSSASLYAPEVDNGYSISVPILSATTALFVPEISTTVELAAPLLASELALYEPTLASVVTLEIPLLEEETELLAPGVGMFIGASGPIIRVVSGRNYTYKVK